MKLSVFCAPILALAAPLSQARGSMGAPDLIMHGGKIVTVDSAFRTVEAVAVSGDKIIATGTSREILKLRARNTRAINLRGRMVLPGLGDSHNHMTGTGLNMLFPSLEGSQSIGEIVARIAKKVAEAKPGEWVQTARIGEPAISAQLKERRYPNRWDLDPVSPNNPVCIPAPHVSIVNSYGLKLTGVTKDTPDPPGGEIVRDQQTGEPTGVFLETAQSYVRKLLPPITDENRINGLLEAMREYNRVGLTSIVEHGVDSDFLRAYQRLWAERRLTTRVYLHVRIDTDKDLKVIEKELDDLSRFASYRGFGDSYLKVAGIKLGFDGGVGIGTALQREPYVGPGGNKYYGIQRVADDKFKEIVRMAAVRNLRVAVHNSGGGAMDKVFGIYEELQKEFDIRPMRFVAVHAQLPSEKNYRQVKDLNLAVVAQPVFEYAMGNMYVKYLGKELADQANPMRSWYEHGIPVGLGSDASVNPYEPLLGIWYTVTRKDKTTGEVIGGDQAISRREALIGYTRNNAYVTFEEEIKGTIEPGKLADLVVLDRDLFGCRVEEIKDVRVLMTVVGGRIVHETPGGI